MNKVSRIQKIIEDSLPAIQSGQETVNSILEKHPKDASLIRPQIEAALWLKESEQSLDPRPGFITSARHYLEQRVALLTPRTALQRLFSRYSPQRWIFNLASPVILVLILALVVNNLVLTARLSIPGDPFYPVKLAIENIQLTFTFDRQEKTNLYLQFSCERTTEFVELVLDGEYDLLPVAASRMESELIASLRSLNALAASEPETELPMVAELRQNLFSEISLLDTLRSTSPTVAHPGIELALQVARTGVLSLH
jgi:hypothetical protein